MMKCSGEMLQGVWLHCTFLVFLHSLSWVRLHLILDQNSKFFLVCLHFCLFVFCFLKSLWVRIYRTEATEAHLFLCLHFLFCFCFSFCISFLFCFCLHFHFELGPSRKGGPFLGLTVSCSPQSESESSMVINTSSNNQYSNPETKVEIEVAILGFHTKGMN